IKVESVQLDVGDYILSSRIGVERKTVDDFLESMISGHLFAQIKRLREAYSRPILIIEGEKLLTKRNISHNAIFGCFVSIIVDFGIPIITTSNEQETADFLSVMAAREQREEKKEVAIRGKKYVMSLKENQQFLLEGLPNVSAVLAKRLLNHFGSIRSIVNASEEELIQVSGIGKKTASDIIALFYAEYVKE
ncbi:MAG: helix-hairpin-helix domain-containing protein, partial [Euryarchaeota archaeon]|nr:helix-hairpin-helix domain-containing protein [Euryarchaeota archaeon]